VPLPFQVGLGRKADHKTRQYCFLCHDGKTAFPARGKCARCHAEPGPAAPLPQRVDIGGRLDILPQS
jgi:uncharacterized OB-fold protein